MPNILANFLTGVGRQVEYDRAAEAQNVQLQGQRAMTELRQLEVQQGRQAMQQQQQEQQARKRIGAFMAGRFEEDAAAATDPAEGAKVFSEGAARAFAAGDFNLGKELEGEAKLKLGEAREGAAQAAAAAQQRREALASSALNFQENPTAEGATAVARAAVAAGVNPLDIPAPNTPEFREWARKQTRVAESSKERLTAMEKSREFDDREARLKEEAKAREQAREEARKDRALAREQGLELRRAMLKIAQEREQRQVAKATAPAKQSVSEANTVNAVVGSAAEAVRGLRVIGAMSPGQTAGAFAGMNSGEGIVSSLSVVGGNKVTPESMQLYQTASAGLGLELGRVLTLGGGRGVNQAQIHEFQRMTQVSPGDTEFEAMFKLANAADIVRNRLSTLPDSQNPKVLKQQREAEDYLAKIPTPEEVIAVARKTGKAGGKLLKQYGTMTQAAEALQSGEVEQKASSASPAAPANLSPAAKAAWDKY